MSSTLRQGLLALAAALPMAATAAPVVVTVSGTVTGTDHYRNSVYFGTTGLGNLNGMTASISITYDSALWNAVVGGGNYLAQHRRT